MPDTFTAKLNTPITAELDARLDRIVKVTGLKKALLIRVAIERQLPDIERNGITFPPVNKLTDNPAASAAAGAGGHQ